MNLEAQVTSLDLSKKLKELGVKQESLFYWNICPDCVKEYPKGSVHWDLSYDKMHGENISAFSVAELGEILKNKIRIDGYYLSITVREYIGKEFYGLSLVTYHQEGKNIQTIDLNGYESSIYDKQPANARAKMVIYLIENGLMEIPK